jgi:hypothetical protein
MGSDRAMNPTGGPTVRRVMETNPLDPVHIVDCDSISGYGPMTSSNRHVRTRMRGGVGRDGYKPSLTRLAICQKPFVKHDSSLRYFFIKRHDKKDFL